MRKKNSYRLGVFTTILFISISFNFLSQTIQNSLSSENINISFGQKLNRQLLGLNEDETTIWSIANKNEIIAESEKLGYSLFDYDWNTPGSYILNLVSDHHGENNCNHENHLQSFNVVVSPQKINYNTDAISFSKELSKTSIESGLVLVIPIDYLSINDNQEFDVNSLKVNFHGIGCSVITRLISPETLTASRKYDLKFEIQGTVEKDSYIMIDFCDHNGNITTYYHLNKL